MTPTPADTSKSLTVPRIGEEDSAQPAAGADSLAAAEKRIRANAVLADFDDDDVEPDQPPIPEVEPEVARQRAILRAGSALTVLATVAVFYAIYAAQAVFIPLMVSLLLALTIRPVVRYLRKFRIPEALSSLVILAALVLLLLFGASRILAPAQHWVSTAPQQIEAIQKKVVTLKARFGPLSDTSKLVKGLTDGDKKEGGEPEPVAVEMRESALAQQLSIVNHTGNFMAHALLILVLAFFILTSGDLLLNQVLTLIPRLSGKKKTVGLVHDIERGIATYLFTVTMINAGVGLATTAILWAFGVPNPALWGFVAFLTNYVPTFGPFVCTIIILCVSVISFDSLGYALLPPAAFVAMTAVEGNLMTPVILGKSMSMNPILVFVSLIFWTWMWGLGGAILAIPMLAVVKIAADKFESTRPIARIISE